MSAKHKEEMSDLEKKVYSLSLQLFELYKYIMLYFKQFQEKIELLWEDNQQKAKLLEKKEKELSSCDAKVNNYSVFYHQWYVYDIVVVTLVCIVGGPTEVNLTSTRLAFWLKEEV